MVGFFAFSIISVTFSAVTLVSVMPLLDVLFNQVQGVSTPAEPAFNLSIDYFIDLFQYNFLKIINTYGKTDALQFVCSFILGSMLIGNTFRYLERIIASRVRLDVVKNLRTAIFTNITRLQISFFNTNRKGDLLSRFTSDVQEVEAAAMNSLKAVMKEPITGSAATTVMNWQSHAPLTYKGQTYGQKDMEFPQFLDLPRLTKVPVEIAVSGKAAPTAMLRERGWRVTSGHQTTISFDSFADYICGSFAEFSVCKNVFVALQTGWFSDRGAAYLASGRPVVQQETGFSRHLPCGAGLFAASNVTEAAQALEEIRARPDYHSRQARAIACEHLEATKVLGKFLNELGF